MVLFPSGARPEAPRGNPEALFEAVRKCRIDDVKRQLPSSETGDINVRNREERTPLIEASRSGSRDIVTFLVERKADPDLSDKGGLTALMWAARRGDEVITRILLRYGAVRSLTTEGDNTAHIPAFLPTGTNLTDEKGWTALIWACWEGHVGVVTLLLASGADTLIADKEGWTALACASYEGHVEIVRILLANGAGRTLGADQRNKALILASCRGHTEIVTQLLMYGAKPDLREEGQEPALVCASREGHKEIVGALLIAGATRDLTGRSGDTALTLASHHGHTEIVTLLLMGGARKDMHNLSGDTALACAMRQEHGEIVRLLTLRNAEEVNPDEGSPLS
ncbi:MAG: ankyrin repeat domain-containing protein [Simkaniaceae bacterium]|nr:ankyrin repeat domain-containing protein [Simkaniaceae bacterium]